MFGGDFIDFISDDDLTGCFKVLAIFEAQPPWNRSKPQLWENLRPPQAPEEKQEVKKGTKLKQLPENLKYIFLDTDEQCPTIINSSLKEVQEDQLIKVLKKYKGAIRWAIEDLKGISPTVCMQKILMEDNQKPVVHP